MINFKEMKTNNPQRYSRLEQFARENGLIESTEQLADLMVNPEHEWLLDWFIDRAEGGTATPGEYLTARRLAQHMQTHKM